MSAYKTAAVLVCAGSGSRMNGRCPDKLLLELDGIPVVVHTLMAYEKSASIDLVIVATKNESIALYRSFKEEYQLQKLQLIVEGGATRTESVLKGARAVPADYDYIAIGDGARPLIRPEDIEKTVEAAKIIGAAALGCYMTDTVKKVEAGEIIETVPRANLVGIQTPQVFKRNEYIQLAEKAISAETEFTDDASIYEHFGKKVAFVEGHRDNMKITVPEDIPVLKAIMEERK